MEHFENECRKDEKKEPTHEERVEGAARLAVKLAAFNTPMGV